MTEYIILQRYHGLSMGQKADMEIVRNGIEADSPENAIEKYRQQAGDYLGYGKGRDGMADLFDVAKSNFHSFGFEKKDGEWERRV